MNAMLIAAPEFPEPPTDFPETLDPILFPSSKNSDEQQPGASGSNNELDFDDLAKRFDMLKKKGAK